jgi:hypothetical protein
LPKIPVLIPVKNLTPYKIENLCYLVTPLNYKPARMRSKRKNKYMRDEDVTSRITTSLNSRKL